MCEAATSYAHADVLYVEGYSRIRLIETRWTGISARLETILRNIIFCVLNPPGQLKKAKPYIPTWDNWESCSSGYRFSLGGATLVILVILVKIQYSKSHSMLGRTVKKLGHLGSQAFSRLSGLNCTSSTRRQTCFSSLPLSLSLSLRGESVSPHLMLPPIFSRPMNLLSHHPVCEGGAGRRAQSCLTQRERIGATYTDPVRVYGMYVGRTAEPRHQSTLDDQVPDRTYRNGCIDGAR